MKNSKDLFDEQLMARYLTGDLSADEYRFFELYLSRDPDTAAKVKLLQKDKGVTSFLKPEPDVEEALQVHYSMRKMASQVKSEYRNFLRHFTRPYIPLAAACLLAIAYISLNWPIGSFVKDGYVEVLSTRRGELASINLMDGTRVTLSPGSRLQVSRGFTHVDRDVSLDGSAIFEVSSHTSIPFRVKAMNTETVVLGTHFGVMVNDRDSTVRVVVRNGRVGIRRVQGKRGSAEQSPAVLEALQAATISNSSIYLQQNINVAKELGWEHGRLTFDSEPLGSVLRMLSDWYGVEFRIDNDVLLNKEITITLDNKSIYDLIKALAVMLDAVITHEGEVITIKSGKQK